MESRDLEKLEKEMDEILDEKNIKESLSVPSMVVVIEQEYIKRLKETGFNLTTRDLKQFMHKMLLVKDVYDKKETLGRTQSEKWKSLKDQILAIEKFRLSKGSDSERNRVVLATSKVYEKADKVYNHYNFMFRKFEKKSKSAENKHFNCKTLIKDTSNG